MKKKVILVRVNHPCPKCEGHLISTGVFKDNKYYHSCDKCGYKTTLLVKYPKYEFRNCEKS